MIRLKTASLIAGGLKIGAIIANAPDDDCEYLYNFGLNIGLAFQLQDDYLDVYGDVDVFGKQIGGDILSNKKTFLLTSALENENNSDYNSLVDWINAEDFIPEEKIKMVTQIYNNQNIKELTKNKMDNYLEKALSELAKVNLPDENKSELVQIAKKLINRIS